MFKILRLLVATMLFTYGSINVAAEQEGFNEIKKKAEKGDSIAQAKIGSIYFLGNNYQLDPTKYKTEYRLNKTKSTIAGLGYLLDDITKNDKEAANWMQKAAEQGLMEAEVFIAAMYDRGLGVKLSTATATKWYQKAADQGNGPAQALLGRYKAQRIQASKKIPLDYALEILTKK
jgi:TPR repeat protein